MHINVTDNAKDEIVKKINTEHQYIKIAHDAEGCGCIMSGVAQLWIVDEKQEFDMETMADSIPFLYDSRHEVFFEDELKLDYNASKKSFSLSSKQQIYNSTLKLHSKN
ncbi:iron-sulfur cluster biosynthesis family protein [Chengkuizengella axinellae]|uniref:Iron-sulfur cluster biosynthesis family protein n=1 Tax=Chengkuizengella axinellae TaxID=3064388 RepID=A0ABT9IXX1_9BACL|nr:iron-sulfur cluster biosynthesis family protein [Chengkuizengella sp. 2205SS18-9]MDP5273962.1 iron-sulfur cluster biosynthesis family protein [Chengkuizengella sp. 2205SS18-9]